MKKVQKIQIVLKSDKKKRELYLKTLISFVVDSSRKYFVADNNAKKEHSFILLTTCGSTPKREGIVLFKAAPSIFSTVENDIRSSTTRTENTVAFPCQTGLNERAAMVR
jgi:hypothetical protein